MGVNNKQRRAAKAKRRAKDRAHGGGQTSGYGGYGGYGGQPHGYGGYDAYASATTEQEALRMLRYSLLGLLSAIGEEPRHAVANAAELLRGKDARSRAQMAGEVRRLAQDVVAGVCGAGWSPTDLAEVLARRAGATFRPTLSALLTEHAARFPAERVAAQWRAELASLHAPGSLEADEVDGLARLLAVTGVLSVLPAITELCAPPGAARRATTAASAVADPRDAKQLARVRALLAKAESTTFDAEAEALTAKAQELISRYALARLLDRADTDEQPAGTGARRIWIDAPYVVAKAMLLGAVAKANRCRTVLSEDLGFLTVVGSPRDLDGVDLLGTSLLVQANTAMLRHGSQLDRSGTSRTRSFRQSFLVSYAVRIGERLAAADATAAEETGQRERLLPVLRANERAVDDHVEQLFPRTTYTRSPQATDGRGWAAGRAAADLALLDLNGQIAATV